MNAFLLGGETCVCGKPAADCGRCPAANRAATIALVVVLLTLAVAWAAGPVDVYEPSSACSRGLASCAPAAAVE